MSTTQPTSQPPAPLASEPTVKRMAVFAAAAGLSTWAIDMAATQVGLPSIFPLTGRFGTAFWVALLTAGLSALMAQNGAASEAAAQASALGALAWISAGVTFVVLLVALLLRNTPVAPPAAAPATTTIQPASK